MFEKENVKRCLMHLFTFSLSNMIKMEITILKIAIRKVNHQFCSCELCFTVLLMHDCKTKFAIINQQCTFITISECSYPLDNVAKSTKILTSQSNNTFKITFSVFAVQQRYYTIYRNAHKLPLIFNTATRTLNLFCIVRKKSFKPF